MPGALVWVQSNFGWNMAQWPPTEGGRAKVCWYLLQQWATEDTGAATFGHLLNPGDSSLASGARSATEAVVEPLIELLQERIGKAAIGHTRENEPMEKEIIVHINS